MPGGCTRAAICYSTEMRNTVKVLAINILVLFILTEALLSLFYYIRDQKFQAAESLFSETFKFDALSNEDCTWGQSVGLHPYLGIYYPSYEQCRSFSRNNFGTRGVDFPLEHDDNYYSILVMGASVAEQLAGHTTIPENVSILETHLNQHWTSPTGKPFKILNASVAGSHQPETLMQAALFIDLADQAISVESYNESGLMFAGELLEQASVAWLQLAAATKYPIEEAVLNFLTKTTRAIANSPLRHSFVLYALLSESIGRLNEDFHQKSVVMDPLPHLPEAWTLERKKQHFLKSYQSYIEKVNALVTARKKEYTLFIQPAPYKYKILTEEERMNFNSYSVSTEDLDAVRGMIKSIKGKVQVESLEKAFIDHSETLYIDHVHTNRKGVEILSEKIANVLAAKSHWKPKKI